MIIYQESDPHPERHPIFDILNHPALNDMVLKVKDHARLDSAFKHLIDETGNTGAWEAGPQ